MSLEIDYSQVESTMGSINNSVSNSSAASDYDELIAGISQSKGEEATALKNMLKKEKQLAQQLNETLTKFAGSIQGAVDEFTRMDQEGKGKIGNIG